MGKSSYTYGTNRPRRRALMWMGVFSLLLSLMTPLMSLDAANAQEEDSDDLQCGPGFVLDENSGECVEDPTLGQPDTPDCNEGEIFDQNAGQCVQEPSLQPTEAPQEAFPTGVQIDKFDCPAASDASTWQLNRLQTQCSANTNAVQMTYGGDGIGEQTQQVQNSAQWTGDPPGNYYVYEQVPDGYGQPRVFCGVYVPQQTQPSFTESNVQNGNTIGWQLDSGEYVYCQWYNMQEDAGYGEIHITKYDCEGYQGDSAQASWQDLQNDCDQRMQGVDYEFYLGQNLADTKTTDNNGEISWDQAPIGDLTIAEGLPNEYTYAQVYCSYHPVNEQNGTYSPVDVQQGFFHSWNMEEGYILDCYWFNFMDQQDYEPNWFEIYKYACPEGTEYDQDKDYYDQECSLYGDGIDFEFTYPNGDSDTKTTDNQGYASWTDFPGDQNQGNWSVQEPPQGYAEPVYYCRYTEWPQDANYTNDWEYMQSSGGSLQGSYDDDGVRYECYVYNFTPEDNDNYNYLDIYKYECDYDAPKDSDQDYYEQNCSPLSDWDFSVSHGGSSSSQSTDNNGYTGWSGVQGDWSASEFVPADYGEPLVWCSYQEWPDEANYDDSWTSYQIAGGSFQGSFEYDNVRIECHVYNFAPEDNDNDYNYLDFYKYVCDYDTPKDQNYEYYLENCEAYPGWDFNVQYNGVASSQSTDDSGKASWNTIPVGQWSASESLPGGYDDPVVWCSYQEWPDDANYDDSWSSYNAPGGYFEGSFDYDNLRYVCYWFNFQPDGGNTVQFYKMWCSEEATYDSSFDDLVGNSCEFRNEPAEVSFTYDGSTSSKTATEQQPAQWQGVPQGEWTVEEAQYDGWGQPVIWCQYVQWPGEYDNDLTQEAFMLSSASWQGTWDNQYDNVTIACVIFNIPYEQNWIEVTKWYCSEDIYLPYEQSADNLLEECERYTDGANFDLQYAGGSESMTTDGDGNAEWDGVPSGQWSMSESVPDGYGNPVVWCRYVEWPEAAGFSEEPMSYSAPNGSFSGEFGWGGIRIHCDVFNIPDYDPGTITAYKWNCPEGVPADSNADYLRDECYRASSGEFEFDLEYGQEGQASVSRTTDSEGKAAWQDVPQGSWTLTEYTSNGFGSPVVYCQWVDWSSAPEGEFNGDLYQPDVTGNSFSGSHEYAGMDLVCYIFNFEYDGGDNWVTFYKYYCEPGSQWGSLEEWTDNCSVGADGSSFTLQNDQGSYPKTTSGGMTEWTGLDNGSFNVQESLPAGYEEPVVWCYYGQYDPNSSEQRPAMSNFDQTDAPEGSWEGSFDGEANRYYCYIFNIPGNDNNITIYKYNCEYRPVGFNTLWQWQEACDTPGNGVGFTLNNLDGSSSKDTASGKVEWTDVPLGEFSVTEDPYAGYGEGVWWCGWTAYDDGLVYDAFPQQVSAPGNVYNAEMTVSGSSWFCYVFNIPDDESRITIYKYNCPEGVQIQDSLGGYQETCTEKGDGINFTLDNANGSPTKSIIGGTTSWYDVPQGEFTLTEEIPQGYGEPVWWCGFTGWEDGAIADGFPQKVNASNGMFTGSIDFDQTSYFCWVFNFPDHDREVTVYKWSCPEGLQPESEDYQDWADTCTSPMSGVGFELTDDMGSLTKFTNASGRARWYGVEPGNVSLQEQYLPGYEQPYVFCSLEAFYDDGAAYAENYSMYSVTDRTVSKDLGDYAEFKWICQVFNVPMGPGEITIVKWYCSPGYDLNKPGADPEVECTQKQDGIDFVLGQPVGPNQMAATGDAGEGAVYFGDLDPGNYTLTEMTPPEITQSFIWDCYGTNLPKVHPNPLTLGNVLNVQVVGGDSITCNWYNIPGSSSSDDGSVALYKYQCSTPVFMSEVDCELYEFGASFELTADGGDSQGIGTTNAGGNFSWSELDPGNYTLDELSGTPCKITSTNVTQDGKIVVADGQETMVKVYNCSSGKPGGKVPTKYPNTGVGQEPQGPVAMPQDDDDDDGDQVIGPDDGTPSIDGTPTAEEAAAQFYSISCLNTSSSDEGTPSGRSPVEETPEADEEEEDGGLPPFLQDAPADEPVATEAPAEENDDVADSNDDAAAVEECERGSVPQNIVIDAANVNYQVEVLEIVDGVMQAPTGPNAVTWYKETARLGEANNMVMAAHLNWWGVPEGPFFYLNTLQEGDRIELTGEDGNTYVYEVQWVQQEDNLSAPQADVVGPTGDQTLTLITCGGEWDASISEYNERTVVRAIQVDVIEATSPNAGDDADDQQAIQAPIALFPVGKFWQAAA